MKSLFNARLLCGETGRFTRRAQNRRSNARRFFSRSSPFFWFILSCFLQFLPFFKNKTLSQQLYIRVFSPMMDIKLLFIIGISIQQNHKPKNTSFSKTDVSKILLYTIVCKFLSILQFSIRIFPFRSASVIRSYLVRVLQTPVSRGVDYNNNIYLLKNKNARRT